MFYKTKNRNIVYRFVSVLILIGSFTNFGFGQDVDLANVKDNFKKDKLLKINGGLTAGLVTYSGNSEVNRNPYTYSVMGNLNFKLFNMIDVPLSMNISNANRGLTLPVTPTRFSIRPRYKFITAHIGDVNLSYSPYTLNGHQFTGLGVDISPEKGKFSYRVMYGKLQKGIGYDSLIPNQISAYERWGYGGQVKYNSDAYSIGINAFSAKDRINSIAMKPDKIGIKPEQNLVGSGDIALRPFKGFEATAELALSAITSELRDSTPEAERTSGFYNKIYPTNNSTFYSKAQKFGLNYQFKKTKIGFGYEKIDPGYRTLGAYFFANDLENFTFNLAKTLMKQKLSFNLVAGVQRDNLNGLKSGTNKRFVGNSNLAYRPNENSDISINYSNFRTFMRIQSQYEFVNQLNQYQSLDTFNFTQITQNFNVSLRQMIKKSENSSKSILANLSIQDASSEQSGKALPNGSNIFLNGNLSFLYSLKKIKLSILTSYLATYNTIGEDAFITQGPAVTVTNSLLKGKMSINFSANYNSSQSDNAAIGDISIINLRLGMNVVFFKKHNLTFSVMNQSVGAKSNQIGNVSYNFFF